MVSSAKFQDRSCEHELNSLVCTLKKFNQAYDQRELPCDKEPAREIIERSYASYVRSIPHITFMRVILDLITFGIFSKYIYNL